ncbi:MAG: helix-turn-helix transcriptional regulator [Chlorobiaceae bacterium]|nr:helix-turn-helix transcriptional regulator [Chlorobiaceae bacterium]
MIIGHGKQKELAEKVGVSPSYMNDILKGRRTCTLRLAARLEAVSDAVLGEKVEMNRWLAGIDFIVEEDGGEQ